MKNITLRLLSLLVLGSMILAACAPATTAAPAATQAPATTAPTAVPPTKAPPTAVPPTEVPPTTAPTEPPAATSPNCGTDPVVMKVVFETGWDMPTQLTEEFTQAVPECHLGHQHGTVRESHHHDADASRE